MSISYPVKLRVPQGEDSNVDGHPVYASHGPGRFEAMEEYFRGYPDDLRPRCREGSEVWFHLRRSPVSHFPVSGRKHLLFFCWSFRGFLKQLGIELRIEFNFLELGGAGLLTVLLILVLVGHGQAIGRAPVGEIAFAIKWP